MTEREREQLPHEVAIAEFSREVERYTDAMRSGLPGAVSLADARSGLLVAILVYRGFPAVTRSSYDDEPGITISLLGSGP